MCFLSTSPPRTPWHGLPDVLIHANESSVKQHIAYAAAKAGDDEAASILIRDSLDLMKVKDLQVIVNNQSVILVSAHAFERNGVNAIPEVFANQLGEILNWSVDNNIVQTNVVAHTGADGFSRLARQAQFAGIAEQGKNYVLVDDFIGMGGTLANLKGHIEAQGGHVLAAVALTGKLYSAKLTPNIETLQELRKKHGTELENWWIERFAHTFDALTQSEARYLTRTASIDIIRNRIIAAK